MSNLSFFIVILISSPYYVPAAAARVGSAHLSDAPPATIPDEVPVNPRKVMTEDFRPPAEGSKSPENPATAAYIASNANAAAAAATTYPSAGEVGVPAIFPEVNASRPNRELIEANASVSPESPGYNKRRKVAMTINKAGGSEPPESPATAAYTASNAAANAAAAATAYPSAGEVGVPAIFPEVNASRPNRELIEANASVSPQSPGYNKRRKLAMTINKAGGSEPPESPATAAAYPSARKVGVPAIFPEVNASRPNRELIAANASVSPESPGYNKRRKLAVTINKAKGSEPPASPAAAATYPSARKLGVPVIFPEVNASRPNRKLIAANNSNSTESPGY